MTESDSELLMVEAAQLIPRIGIDTLLNPQWWSETAQRLDRSGAVIQGLHSYETFYLDVRSPSLGIPIRGIVYCALQFESTWNGNSHTIQWTLTAVHRTWADQGHWDGASDSYSTEITRCDAPRHLIPPVALLASAALPIHSSSNNYRFVSNLNISPHSTHAAPIW